MTIRTTKRGDNKPYVALILQGGGALGAYHIGAYQALEEAGYLPDWVSGISIGTIDSAIIVGNRPGDRLDRLETLWTRISRSDYWGTMLFGEFRKLYNTGSAMAALLFGQPNFFTLRFPSPYFASAGTPGATSFYDTSLLRGTLEQLASFELINSRQVRLSLGATQVTTGNLVFFDNTRQRIGPEHVMASGSLPPGFPAIWVNGELYWDGGCISNTPLEAILDDEPKGHTLVFMIDLWDAEGPEPQTMNDVLWRQKQIQYASRTAHHIDSAVKRQNLRRSLSLLARHLPPAALASPAVKDTLKYETKMDIVHIIYHPGPDQVPQSDADFSRLSIADRWSAGYHDMKLALEKAPWFKDTPEYVGAVVHRVKGGKIISTSST